MSDDHRGKPALPSDKTIMSNQHRVERDRLPTAVGGSDEDFDNALDAALGGNTVLATIWRSSGGVRTKLASRTVRSFAGLLGFVAA